MKLIRHSFNCARARTLTGLLAVTAVVGSFMFFLGARPSVARLEAGVSAAQGVNQASQFQLTGTPNTIYALQATTNLADWTTIFTGQSAPDGTLRITDGAMGLFHSRFYRARPVLALAANLRPERILVKPLPGVNLSTLNLALGVTVLHTFPSIGNLQILQVPANTTSDALINIYQQSGLVQYAEHDFIVHALNTPNDFYYQQGNQWNLNNIGQQGGIPDADIDGPEGWDTRTSAAGVLVAVIDTGVRYTHEDLASNIWVNPGETPGNGIDDDADGYVDDLHGINAITGSGDPADDHGHGTHVSGIIGAVGNDSMGIAGICWQAQIMACKFLDSQGSGSISDAITCIDYARSKGAKIINASWGTTAFNSSAFHDAIDSARAADIIFVAAAGNSGEDNQVNPVYPASYDLDNIVSVAATTRTDDLASFSNYGATNVDLAAPGSPIFSCWGSADNAYQYMDGTSMAAAHVSGVCALLRAQYPNETYRQIINRVLSSTDPRPGLAGKCVTGGRLNLANALGGITPPPQAVVTLTAIDPDASETGPDPGVIRFHRTGDTSQPLDVSWSFSGTAVNGTDYQQLPTTGTIPAGQADADLTITPIDDTLVEGDETVVVTVVSGAGYTTGSPATATVTIHDNDGTPPPTLPVVTLDAVDPNASETGPDPGVIRFHRTGDTSQPLDVSWSFSGTAINGTDYQQLPTTGTIPAGQADADLTITPIDDTVVEGDETVVVTVVSGTGYTTGSPATATVVIHDNDSTPPPAVTADFTANPTSGPAPLGVQFTDQSTGPVVSWSWSFGDGTTSSAQSPLHTYNSAGTYTALLTVTGSSGQTSSKSATIAVSSPPPPPSTVTVVATQPLASLLIPGEFTITRAGDTSSALTVNYSLGGTAVNGVDYQTLSGSAVISAGASSTAVLVQPRTSLSLLKTVVLTLSPGSNYNVGSPNSATVTIVASIGLTP